MKGFQHQITTMLLQNSLTDKLVCQAYQECRKVLGPMLDNYSRLLNPETKSFDQQTFARPVPTKIEKPQLKLQSVKVKLIKGMNRSIEYNLK